jgi:hypothetical protein
MNEMFVVTCTVHGPKGIENVSLCMDDNGVFIGDKEDALALLQDFRTQSKWTTYTTYAIAKLVPTDDPTLN